MSYNSDFSQVLAGIEAKADSQATSDAEAMISYGKAKLNDGTVVNSNDTKSLGRYHAEALASYNSATTMDEKRVAMARIKAAQNLLSKTDSGRSQVQDNLEDAVSRNQLGGLADASAHLMSNFGDTYKSKNRGAHGLIKDLSTAQRGENGELADVSGMNAKLLNGSYDSAGISKYTAESLAGADTQALRRMANEVASGRVQGNDLATIRETAGKVISMYDDGKLNVQPEAMSFIRSIVGNSNP